MEQNLAAIQTIHTLIKPKASDPQAQTTAAIPISLEKPLNLLHRPPDLFHQIVHSSPGMFENYSGDLKSKKPVYNLSIIMAKSQRGTLIHTQPKSVNPDNVLRITVRSVQVIGK